MELVFDMYLVKLHEARNFYRDLSYIKMLFTFLLVSHRIRGIALNTPTLWSIVFIGQIGRYRFPNSLFLERSRNAPLKVIWRDETDDKEKESIWHHRRRWGSLIVVSDVSFVQSCPGGLLDFPALEMLLTYADDSSMRSYSSFRMPALKQLILKFVIAWQHTLRDLAATLANCKALKHLTLEVNEGEYPIHPYPSFDLPSLCSFKVKIWHHTHLRTSAILQLFRVPNLRRFSIYIHTPCDIPLDVVFDNLNFGESIQSLEFFHSYFLGDLPFSVPFQSIARQFSNISELYICCKKSPITEQLRDCLMPTLLHLLALWESGDPDTQDTFVDDMLVFLANRKMHFDGQEGGYVPLRLTVDSSMNYHERLESAVADGLVILERGSWRNCHRRRRSFLPL